MTWPREVQLLSNALHTELGAAATFGQVKTFARRAMGLLKDAGTGEEQQAIAHIAEASFSKMVRLDQRKALRWLATWDHVDDWFGLDLKRLRKQLGPAT